jgi:ABC-2 type transport system ATP-binding protein
LLTQADITQIRAKKLSQDCIDEIRQVIDRHQSELVSVEHPTTTLEELFLSIVRDSEARPGRRVVHEAAVGPPPSPN